MPKNRFYWGFIVVGLVLGFMFAMQFRTQAEIVHSTTVKRVQQLAQEVESVREERDALQTRVQELRGELDEVAEQARQGRLKDQLDNLRIQAGLRSLTGPGIEVVLQDSDRPLQSEQNPNFYILHDEDLSKVINELRVAGAEALAINGERLVATSEIRCIGPTVLVNKTKRLAPPYTITAIGDPDTLVAALEMRGGVIDTLGHWGIQVTIHRVPEAVVPAYTGALVLNYARPLLQEGGG